MVPIPQGFKSKVEPDSVPENKFPLTGDPVLFYPTFRLPSKVILTDGLVVFRGWFPFYPLHDPGNARSSIAPRRVQAILAGSSH